MQVKFPGLINVLLFVGSIMLFISCPPFSPKPYSFAKSFIDLPSSYYKELPWIICSIALYGVYLAVRQKKYFWVISLSIIAILLNPLFNIYFLLGSEKLLKLRMISGIFFLVASFKIEKQTERF